MLSFVNGEDSIRTLLRCYLAFICIGSRLFLRRLFWLFTAGSRFHRFCTHRCCARCGLQHRLEHRGWFDNAALAFTGYDRTVRTHSRARTYYATFTTTASSLALPALSPVPRLPVAPLPATTLRLFIQPIITVLGSFVGSSLTCTVSRVDNVTRITIPRFAVIAGSLTRYVGYAIVATLIAFACRFAFTCVGYRCHCVARRWDRAICCTRFGLRYWRSRIVTVGRTAELHSLSVRVMDAHLQRCRYPAFCAVDARLFACA